MNRPTPALFLKKSFESLQENELAKMLSFVKAPAARGSTVVAQVSRKLDLKKCSPLKPLACDMDSQRDALQQMKEGQQEALQLLKEEIGMLHAEVKQLKDSL